MVYALHTDPDSWSGDPHGFEPGRWLAAAHPSGAGRAAGEGNLSPRSTLSDRGVKGAFVPFLDGQRQCQGRWLAELEFMVMMHALLMQFDLSLAQPGFDVSLKADMYPTLERPIMVRARRRTTGTTSKK